MKEFTRTTTPPTIGNGTDEARRELTNQIHTLLTRQGVLPDMLFSARMQCAEAGVEAVFKAADEIRRGAV